MGFCELWSIMCLYHKGGKNMNTDKIYAEQLANEYSKKETSKVKQLKKLDVKAKRPANIFTYTFGIISSLVLGTGMSFAMGVIGSGMIGLISGIAVGVVGLIGCGINYPIYKKLINKGKDKYASDILRLAKEISEE